MNSHKHVGVNTNISERLLLMLTRLRSLLGEDLGAPASFSIPALRNSLQINTPLSSEAIDLVMKYIENNVDSESEPLGNSIISPEAAQRILYNSLSDRIELLIAEKNKPLILSLNAAEGSRAAIPWLKRIAGYKTQGSLIQGLLGNQPLSKPLILLMPYQNTVASMTAKPVVSNKNAAITQSKDMAKVIAREVNHQWVSCIVLPKNYQAPDGTKTGNDQGEVIYYLDPQHTQKPPDMPQRFWTFFQLLTKGVSFKERVPNNLISHEVVISPPFPRGMFFNGSQQQQCSCAESFNWAIYNAMMVVLTDNTNFIATFAQLPKANINLRLSQLLKDLEFDANKLNVSKMEADMPNNPVTPKVDASFDIPKVTSPIPTPMSTSVSQPLRSAVSIAASDPVVPPMPEATIDPSPNIPAYSAKTIKLLLSAYGIKDATETSFLTLPKDSNEQVEHYFYPTQALTPDILLRDSILYFLCNKEIKNRRVCFLLQGSKGKPLAMILQLSQVNPKIVEALRKQIPDQKTAAVDKKDNDFLTDMLRGPEGIALIKQLYGQVQGIFLGSLANAVLAKQLQPLFENAFVGQVVLNFKNSALVNPSIQLADDILQMLKIGKTRNLPSAEVFIEHRELCVKVLLRALCNLGELKTPTSSHNASQKGLIEKIEVLLKYLSVEQYRARYPKIRDTLEDLENLKSFDLQIKRSVYAKQFNMLELQQGLCQLDLLPIIDMLELKDKPASLLQQLEQGWQQAEKKINNWETELQKQIKQAESAWLPYLWHKSTKTTNFLYQNSLIKFCADSVHWIGQSIGQAIPNHIKIKTKDFIQRSTKWTVLSLTLSPRLARKSYDAVGRLLNQDNVSLALKTSGAALGWMVMSAQGAYTAARMFGLSVMTFYCYQQVSLPRIVNDRATLVPGTIQFSPNNLFRLLNIVTAILEAAYYRNPHSFFHALGGIGSSATFTYLAQRYVDVLKSKPGKPPTEDQVLILFLFSVAGYDIGRALGQYGYQAILSALQRQQLRANIIERLQALAAEQHAQDFTIESDELSSRFNNIANPLLWLKPNTEKIKFSWRGLDEHFHQAVCDLDAGSSVGIGANGNTNNLACAFSTSPPRLNGPS